jgi:uncharacterized protein (TIGR03435 family)
MLRTIAGLILCVAGAGYGQPRFEVASIKPSADPSPNSSGSNTGKGRLSMTNVTLKRCIMGAYGLGPNLIAGGPDWMDTDRFVIAAKAEEAVGDHALMAMLQTLLAERFRLAVHRETRTAPAYLLEVAKNGPKLEKAETGGSSTSNGRGNIEVKATTLERFAEVLSRQMDLPVVDRTGLEGIFNMKLQWTPESKPAKPEDGSPREPGLSVFTAIQEQLGLRLRVQKAPVEMLVVDHAEKPSEN